MIQQINTFDQINNDIAPIIHSMSIANNVKVESTMEQDVLTLFANADMQATDSIIRTIKSNMAVFAKVEYELLPASSLFPLTLRIIFKSYRTKVSYYIQALA